MNRGFLFFVTFSITVVLTKSLEDSIDFSQLELTPRKDYSGHQVWKVFIQDRETQKLLANHKTQGHLFTWGGNKTHIDVLINPDYIDELQEDFAEHNLIYKVIIEDLKTVIDSENPPITEENEDRQGHRMNWKAYQRAGVIWGYMDFLAQTYPDLCKVFDIGKTYYGRPIKVLKISNGNSSNKAVWIDGGIHAREWISPAAVTYIINYLMSNFENEPSYIQNVDYYIAPVLNPDGYEYSHVVDRLWRKNLSPSKALFKRCVGVDLNRNFGYEWGREGVSSDQCSDIYGGPAPFSELESQAMKKFIEGTKIPWSAYISFHSYGHYIMYPWGHSKTVPADYKELDEVGRRAAQAIVKAGGPQFIVGSSGITLYPAAGGSDDWAKGSANFKYSYTIELQDDGRYGFLLPANLILNASKDALIGTQVILEAVAKL